MMLPLLTASVTREMDVVTARRRARQVATLLGFDDQDGTRIATAVSEIARNAHSYGRGGRVEFLVARDAPRHLVVRVTDQGPGIAELDEILAGRYHSPSGSGLGLLGARRLMDQCDIETSPGQGTTVTLRKRLPGTTALNDNDLARVAERLAHEPQDIYQEVCQQNHDLLVALKGLQEREEALQQLNRELEETNRGVVALSAELEDKAEHLRRANDLKSRFLSHASHEFRTPLNAIIGLTRLLLSRAERDPEETKQLTYIQQSSQELRDMVDDLLDLAKVEAGKVAVEAAEFSVADVFGALRGMFRPLLTSEAVSLSLEDAETLPPMVSDEGKVAQIVRNLVSNALKFTEHGEVRVWATHRPEDDTVLFHVRDTGIGISEEHLTRIFEEFSQVNTPLHRRVKGTGLGLPLSRRLAALLGGTVSVESRLGTGSTFVASIPRVHASVAASRTVLVIDDADVSRLLLQHALAKVGSVVLASSGPEGLALARERRPDLILLDLNMPGMGGIEVLRQLRQEPELARIPVAILTAQRLQPYEKTHLSRLAVAVLSKDSLAEAESLLVDFGPPVTLSFRAGGER